MKKIQLHFEYLYLAFSRSRIGVPFVYVLILINIFAKEFYIRKCTKPMDINISNESIFFSESMQFLLDIHIPGLKLSNIQDVTLTKYLKSSNNIQDLIIHYRDNISHEKKQKIVIIAMNQGLIEIYQELQRHGIQVKHRRPIFLTIIFILISAFVLFILGIVAYQAFA